MITGRKALLWLHLWMGLAAAAFLLVECLSGTALALRPEFNQLFFTHEVHVTSTGANLPLAQLIAKQEKAYPGRHVGRISPGDKPSDAWTVRLQTNARDRDPVFVALDPHTGEVLWNVNQHISGSQKVIGDVLAFFGRFHGNFLGSHLGAGVIGATCVLLLLLGLSGIVLWWPRKILRWRRGGAARRVFDLHNSLGFYSSLLLILFACTTITMEWPLKSVNLINRLTGAPASKITGEEDGAAAARAQKKRLGGPGAARPIALGPDQIVRIAQAQVPNGTWAGLFLPDAGSPRCFAYFKLPGEKRVAGVSLTADGQVLATRIPTALTPSENIVLIWMRDIHTGEIYGTPSRIAVIFLSLSLATLAVTGPLIWLIRRRRLAAHGQAEFDA